MNELDTEYLIELLDHYLTDDEHMNKQIPYVAFYEEGDTVYYNWEEPEYSVETEVIRGVYNIVEHYKIDGTPTDTGYTLIEVQVGNE